MVSGDLLIRSLRLMIIGNLLVLTLHSAPSDPAEATLTIQAADLLPYKIPRNITGKFCEHLGANIYNGMDAQILRNPTFADFPFSTPEGSPDGLATFHWESAKIDDELRRQAERYGWPESDLSELVKSRHDGLACFWCRDGAPDNVLVSPDTGPAGGRAQRIEIKSTGGIKQWTWLPLHRTRKYEFELFARSPNLARLSLSITRADSTAACASASIEGLTSDWRKVTGTLVVSSEAPADSPYCVTLNTDSAGQIVIAHLFLRPTDHINGADPDVVRLLKEARLPLLRWPGGNFVSAYHWEDGVGPIETRPTKPNYAWGGVEPNTFGTDEFISFCQAVGCEPMLCINAGTGTPEEAARWVEYCNGLVSSPMGARRAANGRPEPYHVRHWEVGNELWGRWQAHWTTADGYVDRYLRFTKALQAADPSIQLYACGAPVLWGKAWNDKLIAGAAQQLRSITDHPLIGGDVPRNTEPLDVFADFMLVPDILERKWAALRDDMARAGIQEPRLAVTELQMFAHLGKRGETSEPDRLNRENLVNPGTLAEALYDTLVYHAAVRLQPFVELVTHSATVNHGGGLRKERERVYANPCYFANALFADFAEAQPVKVSLTAPRQRAPIVLPDIRNKDNENTFSLLDAIAARNSSDNLLLSLVHRGANSSIRLRINIEGYSSKGDAVVRTLSGPVPWTANSREHPEAIRPSEARQGIQSDSITLEIKPFSLVQIEIAKKP